MNGFNLISREKSPCKNCSERHELCWGKCEKYKAWKSKIDDINKRRREYNEKLFAYYSPHIYRPNIY